MSINAYKPHLLVLPEDDANREMANGFLLDSRVLMCNMSVLPPAGGWRRRRTASKASMPRVS